MRKQGQHLTHSTRLCCLRDHWWNDSIHEEQVGRQQSLPVSRSPPLSGSSLMHPILFFFSELKKNHARINSMGAEASQKSHQSLLPIILLLCKAAVPAPT